MGVDLGESPGWRNRSREENCHTKNLPNCSGERGLIKKDQYCGEFFDACYVANWERMDVDLFFIYVLLYIDPSVKAIYWE